MKRTGSILWILLLLALLFFGPAVLFRHPVGDIDPSASLRETVAQEELVDAPADLKPAPPAR
ncbi:MAG: hypothetical protein HYV15_01570 [Elusimicrobia bacterium]|nr:hypothetical protein [Elusimicrobiota bacterium]